MSTSSWGQGRNGFMSREIATKADNDIFFHTDYYYTAGLQFDYRKLVARNTGLHRLATGANDSSRLIINYTLGSKIFNSRSIFYKETATMDRPYAGWTFAGFNVTRFQSPTKGIGLGLELGIVGNVTGLGQLQRWWHRQTHFLVPKGWGTQIRNEVVINLNFNVQRSVRLSNSIDLVSSTAIHGGTGLNRISQDATFRFLQFKPISQSFFTNSFLSWNEPSKKNKEFFLFAGAGVDYTASNIFIEGSLFQVNQSLFTVDAKAWMIRCNFGLMYSQNRSSFSATVHHLSKEVAKGISHNYASLSFAYRF